MPPCSAISRTLLQQWLHICLALGYVQGYAFMLATVDLHVNLAPDMVEEIASHGRLGRLDSICIMLLLSINAL